MGVTNGDSWDSCKPKNLSNSCSSCGTDFDKIGKLETRIVDLEQTNDLHRRVNGELREAYIDILNIIRGEK